MARGAISQPYKNVSGGFITEATGLTFPPNTAADLLNIDLSIDGSARRRLGLDLEPNGGDTASPGTHAQTYPILTVHEWEAVAGDPSLNFIVVQVGAKLHVYNRAVTPMSETSTSITKIETPRIDILSNLLYGPDLEPFSSFNFPLEWHPLQSTSGDGRLWMTSEVTHPFYLEYDNDAASPTYRHITAYKVGKYYDGTEKYLAIRDFSGYDEENRSVTELPTVLTDEHYYNLISRGWHDSVMADWNTTTVDGYPGTWPALGMVWFLGKDSGGDFRSDALIKYKFTSDAPMGNLLLDPLTGTILNPEAKDPEGYDNSLLSGQLATYAALQARSLVSPYPESRRSFRACAWFAGRLWLAGLQNSRHYSGLYFSQVVNSPEQASVFHSANNPTDENFPDVLETDGGVIYIKDADSIERMIPAGIGMLVIARNGVWFVRGGEVGFSATTYAVDRISSVGTTGPATVIEYEGSVFYWSTGGVYQVQFNNGIAIASQPVTDQTIRKFFKAIPFKGKERAHGFVDELSKRIIWHYYDGEYEERQALTCYNRALIYDLRLGAWTKYTLPGDNPLSRTSCPSQGFAKKESDLVTLTENVTLNDGTTNVTLNDGTTLVTVDDELAYYDAVSNVKVVILQKDTTAGLADSRPVMAEYHDLTFYDFTRLTGEPIDYNSLIVTAPDVVTDPMRYKQATYVHSYFRKTERGFNIADDGQLVADFPSSALIRGRWDWHTSDAGNRWTNQQQAYTWSRRYYAPTNIGSDFDTGEQVVYTKRKIRGKGRALSLSYESESGKDMQLLGYSTDITSNAE